MPVTSSPVFRHAIFAPTWNEPSSNRWVQAFHQMAAVVIALMLAPCMLLIAAAVALTDGRPVLYRHYRVGRGGRPFGCWKFRTMRMDADAILARHLAEDPQAALEWHRDRKLANDPRITVIGRWLRRSSLDELPQLFNVMRGDMALVGPRPVTRPELDRYGDRCWHYLSVRPGMTGLWQVSGRNRVSYDERVELDRRYVETRSLRSDLRILARTIRVVITGHGAS